jgi:hypothetical protein
MTRSKPAAKLIIPSMHGTELQALWQEVNFENPQGAQAYSKGQLVEIVWSLAKATHWTPKVSAATARLSSTGGLRSLQPRQVARLLFALATLNHAPVALLSTDLPQLSGGYPVQRMVPAVIPVVWPGLPGIMCPFFTISVVTVLWSVDPHLVISDVVDTEFAVGSEDIGA